MKFKDLVERNLAGFFIVENEKLVYVNPRFAEMLGYEPEELINTNPINITHPDYRHVILENLKKRKDGFGGSLYYESKSINKNGDSVWVEVFSNTTIFNGRKAIIGTVFEITDRKKAQEELIKSEANLKSIFNNTEIGFVLMDNEYNIVSYNKTFQEGYCIAAGIEIDTLKNYFDHILPERAVAVREYFDTVRLTSKSLEYEVQYNTLERGMMFFNIIVSPVLSNNESIGICITAYNITEKKKADTEKQKITDDLIQRNKDLEQFAYIVSHNLRAPVANIKGITNILKDAPITDDEKIVLENGLYVSAEKLDEVIKDLNNILQVKRSIIENKVVVKFAEMVETIKHELLHSTSEISASISYDFSEIEEIATIKSYMHSIFYNLISNSLKYKREGVPCMIEICSKKKGNSILLFFKDNGMGIDLSRKGDQVFGLYKRFHGHVEGKGVGLYMVKTQVQTLGGNITISSEVNKGTEFCIELMNTI